MIQVLPLELDIYFFSSFSLLPNVYASPQPAMLTAQRANEAPLTTPRTVNLFLIPCTSQYKSYNT